MAERSPSRSRSGVSWSLGCTRWSKRLRRRFEQKVGSSQIFCGTRSSRAHDCDLMVVYIISTEQRSVKRRDMIGKLGN